MSSARLQQCLETHGIEYSTIPHPVTYTAMRTAEAAHVPGGELAKCVIISIEGQMAMAVIPSTHRLDLDKLGRWAGLASVRLASEEEFKSTFPDCEIGAMPPFGNLYGVQVYVADVLAHEKRIVFNAGSHSEAIEMTFADFDRLVKPVIAPISVPALA